VNPLDSFHTPYSLCACAAHFSALIGFAASIEKTTAEQITSTRQPAKKRAANQREVIRIKL